MKRAEAPGVVAGSPPRCLYAREVPAVWGDDEDDVLTARARWQEASDSWRASSQGASVSSLPGGGRRSGWSRDPMSFMALERLLAVHDLTVDDLPALAAEARATFPWLWDRSWLPGHERMSAQEFAAWAANLAP